MEFHLVHLVPSSGAASTRIGYAPSEHRLRERSPESITTGPAVVTRRMHHPNWVRWARWQVGKTDLPARRNDVEGEHVSHLLGRWKVRWTVTILQGAAGPTDFHLVKGRGHGA